MDTSYFPTATSTVNYGEYRSARSFFPRAKRRTWRGTRRAGSCIVNLLVTAPRCTAPTVGYETGWARTYAKTPSMRQAARFALP